MTKTTTFNLEIFENEFGSFKQFNMKSTSYDFVEVWRDSLFLGNDFNYELPSIYFLISEGESNKRIYVGRTTNISQRLKEHRKNKNWWEKAFIVCSEKLDANSLEKIEHYFINKFKSISDLTLENSNLPSSNLKIDDHDERLIIDIEKFLKFNYEIKLSEISKNNETSKNKISEVIELKLSHQEKNTSGILIFDGYNFILKSGSTIASDSTFQEASKIHVKGQYEYFKSLLNSDKVINSVLQEDLIFLKPSRPAVLVLGRAANGWTEWKDSNGKTLEELVDRKSN